MSTIALAGEGKGIRQLILLNAVDVTTTIPTFLATGVNGNIVITGEGGAAYAGGADKMLITRKDSAGRIFKSQVIEPKRIRRLRAVAPQAKVGKKIVITVGSVSVGTDYMIDLKVNYANREENFCSVIGNALAVTGDTVTTLATKLAASLANNIDASLFLGSNGTLGTSVIIAGTSGPVNKYFTITVVAGAITIQEKDFISAYYIAGKKTYDQLMWNAVAKDSATPFGFQTSLMTQVLTPGVFAKGQGYQVRDLEWALDNHYGEVQTRDVTLSLDNGFDSNLASTYYTIDLDHDTESRHNVAKSYKSITLACATKAEINKVGTALAAASGLTWTDFA